MTPDTVVDVFQQMLYVVMMTVAVIVIPGLLVGLIVAVFQAATQINEMTLSFLPKLFVILFVIGITSPWLLKLLISYTQNLVLDIPFLIG